MREAFHHIRKAYLDRLTNAISIGGSYVPVYNRVPTNTNTPFIRIYSYLEDEIDQNQSSFITECITRIECITSFLGDDGGEYQLNQIVDGVLNLIRTRSSGYIDLSSDNFNVYTTTIDRIRYFEDYEQNETFFRAVIEVSNRVEKI